MPSKALQRGQQYIIVDSYVGRKVGIVNVIRLDDGYLPIYVEWPQRKEAEVGSKLNWVVCSSITYSNAKKDLGPSSTGAFS